MNSVWQSSGRATWPQSADAEAHWTRTKVGLVWCNRLQASMFGVQPSTSAPSVPCPAECSRPKQGCCRHAIMHIATAIACTAIWAYINPYNCAHCNQAVLSTAQ